MKSIYLGVIFQYQDHFPGIAVPHYKNKKLNMPVFSPPWPFLSHPLMDQLHLLSHLQSAVLVNEASWNSHLPKYWVPAWLSYEMQWRGCFYSKVYIIGFVIPAISFQEVFPMCNYTVARLCKFKIGYLCTFIHFVVNIYSLICVVFQYFAFEPVRPAVSVIMIGINPERLL